jgi:excisionase family DNA binding protein
MSDSRSEVTGRKSATSPMTAERPARLLYSIKHAAEKLDLGVSTIWSMIARGEIRTVQIGRSRRIPDEELKRIAGGAS